MNESHKYKLIYFHIPKCAGVSVRKAIGIDKSTHPFPHKNVSTALAIDVRYTTNDDIYNSYHKFSIIRNPFERMVSLYSFRKKQGDLYIHANLFDSDIGSDGKIWDFNRWIKSPEMKGTTDEGMDRMCSDGFFNSYWYYKSKDRGFMGRNYLRSHLEFLNQVDFLSNPLTGGRLMTDTILRQESLNEEWDAMFKKLGHIPPKLPQRNKSEHKHYSHYYDDESIWLVSKMFNKDLNFFGYEFEDKR
jgi:hypothetical protein